LYPLVEFSDTQLRLEPPMRGLAFPTSKTLVDVAARSARDALYRVTEAISPVVINIYDTILLSAG
jgi:hypothetical protein